MLQADANLFETETASGPKQAQHAEQESEITDAVHHKGLLGGIGGGISVVPKAHEQVGAHPYQLPEDINLQQVGANDQSKHRTAEQGQVGEEAHITLVVGHVAIGIDHHQQGNGGD